MRWVVCLAFMGISYAADPHDPATLALARAAFEGWLTATHLSESFEAEKLRWGTRPDDAQSTWLKLELRFVTRSGNQEQEIRRFADTCKVFQDASGLTLPEKLFYKFIHVSGAARSDAAVYISVSGTSYGVFFDKSEGRLTLREGADRNVRRSAALGLEVNDTAGKKPTVTLPSGVGRGSLSARIQTLLQEYFTAQNRDARLPPPHFDPKALEEDYAGVDVDGVRQQVVVESSSWEKLEISIEVKSGPDGRRLICYLDGRYASGLGTRLPAAEAYADMEPKYTTQLGTFADKLLRKLQSDLAASPR